MKNNMKYFLTVIGHFITTVLILKLISAVLPDVVFNYYSFVCNAVLCVTVSFFTFVISKQQFLNAKIRPANKAVFITGCDSGFGNLLAKRLDSKGFLVFAGCLFPSGDGATELKKSCSNRLQVIDIDVTKDESVKRASQIVQENLGNSNKLWAIVNNAGIQKGFLVELTPFEWFKEVLDVNTFGHIRVAKAFLPSLRQSKGRVVNITSVAARFPHPQLTPYCMSKYASQAFNDCLRMELMDFGVNVISIEPQAFESTITDPDRIRKAFDVMLRAAEDDIICSYEGKYLERSKNIQELFIKSTSPHVHLVIDDIEAAITSVYPNSSYQTRSNMFLAISMKLAEIVPSFVQDYLYRITHILSWMLVVSAGKSDSISKLR